MFVFFFLDFVPVAGLSPDEGPGACRQSQGAVRVVLRLLLHLGLWRMPVSRSGTLDDYKVTLVALFVYAMLAYSALLADSLVWSRKVSHP
jgi:hypothetical protein